MLKVKLDWGTEGLEFALKNKDIVVIVDAIRFSSAVVTAVANGFTIYPVSDFEKGKKLAKSIGAELSGKSGKAKYSLSPASFLKKAENKEIVLCSPNGARCSEMVKDNIGAVGSFLNAKAVGKWATKTAKEKKCDVTLIAAGEQRVIESGGAVYVEETPNKVFAIEDYLGCGAIISYIDLDKSSEAEVCELAFKASKHKLRDLLMNSISGKYLIQKNLAQDVEDVAKLNYYDVVPKISDGKIKS